MDGLHRVALGPRVPTPPITVRKTVGMRRLVELREAFHATVDDPATDHAREALRISGFVDIPLDEYLATLALGAPR